MDGRSGRILGQIRNTAAQTNLNTAVFLECIQSNNALGALSVSPHSMCRGPPVALFLRITKKAEEIHMELNQIEIGKRIKMIRQKKRLSQIAFAAELHVSREQISRWENGSKIPALDILCQLSVIGKVSMDYLIMGQEKDCPEKRIISTLLGDLLELERRIDRVIELIIESEIV